MERSEWSDDEYPSAPVPRHERQWRHPSEVGAAHWERTEPPLALGRGLLATTGLIGVLLAVGVLWVMLPSGPDDDTAIDVPIPVDSTEARDSTDPRPTFTTRTTAAVSTVTTTTPPSSTASVPAPVATVAFRRDASSAPSPAVAVVVASGSMVVTTARALDHDGQTAERLDIRLADGSTASASVLLVDSRSGLAVLTLPEGAASGGFQMADVPEPGERLTILADRPRTVVMPGAETAPEVTPDTGENPETGGTPERPSGLRMPDAQAPPTTTIEASTTTVAASTTTAPATAPPPSTSTSTTSTTTSSTSTTTTTSTSTTTTTTTAPPTTTVVPPTSTAPVSTSRAAIAIGRAENIDANEIPEGTPVVDAEGRLVGICSHADDGHTLLLVRLDALLRTAGSQSATPRGWLGIVLGSGETPLTITAVDSQGPAAAAGLSAGNRIVAVEGHAVETTADLAEAMASKRPGDKVMVTIAGTIGGPAQRTVTITLAERAPQL